jgi:hypothetical protein
MRVLIVRAFVGESLGRGKFSSLVSGNREDVVEVYRELGRMRGPRAGPASAGSDEAAARGGTEFRRVSASGNKVRKGRKRTKGCSSSANMAYRTRVVNNSQRNCLLESYSNDLGNLRLLSSNESVACE